MYNVTSQYRQAIKNEVQVTKVRGIIGTIPFNMDNIMRDSFSISNQCTDTNDVVLGSCYIGQLNATFTGIEIARTEWMNKTIVPYFQMWYDSQNFDEIPLGVYTIKEVSHTAEGVEVTAYDNMCKFDKKFKKTGLNMVAHPYDFLTVFCQKCGVSLGMTQNEVEALPNGTANLYLCGVRKSTTTYANDIETYRDALFWLAQCMACFATMDRSGALVLRAYKDSFDDYISDAQRLSGATFADYITSYTGIYTESLYDGETTYYGYDLATLQQMRDTAMQELEQIITDLADLEEEYRQGQITEEEYKAQKKVLTSEKKAKEKYISWLDKMIAQAQAEGDGAYMDLGANPFFQRRDANIPSIADATLATTLRSHILSALGKIEYTPFSCSSVFGVHYDLGDVIEFNGGHADDDHGCIMSYEWTLHGQYNMEGYGIDPDKQNVKAVDKKQSERAQQNALNSSKNISGSGVDIDAKDGDLKVTAGGANIDTLDFDHVTAQSTEAHPISITNEEVADGNFYTIEIKGIPSSWGDGEELDIPLDGLSVDETYKIEFDGQFTQAASFTEAGSDYVYICGTQINLVSDTNEHHYSGTFTYTQNGAFQFRPYRVKDNAWFTYVFKNLSISKVNDGSKIEVHENNEWRNVDFVRRISGTSSSGKKIGTAENSDDTTTDIYVPNMSGASASAAGSNGLVPAPASGDESKFLRGDGTWQNAGGGGNDVGLSVGSNGAIQSTYTDGTEQTEDILRDDTGEDIATILDSIADTLNLLNQPEVYAPIVYSTEEREVGVWTDGKPLYQKTYSFNNIRINNNGTNISSGIDNRSVIEQVVYAVGNQILTSNTCTSNLWVGQSNGTDLMAYCAEAGNFDKITLQYTKTTDIAGSGMYAALGVPSHHYSTIEHVVGTWFGETLYEKTFLIQNATIPSNSFVLYHTSDYISNIKENVKVECVTKNNKVVLPLLYANSLYAQYNLDIGLFGNDLYISRGSGGDFTDDFYVTLQYTKTS